jgi:hypothetical protein
MKLFLRFMMGRAFLGACLILFVTQVQASSPQYYRITSPDHEQTFAYGMEQNRVWVMRGADRHLAIRLTYTNDPFVDRINPRQTDNFEFHFPAVRLDAEGHTFYYHAPGGQLVPVATRKPGFLGIDEIRLLPTSDLDIQKPHGYLTLVLTVGR